MLAAAGRLGIRPGVHLLGADCVIDLAGHTIDDHVAALSTRQRRTNFRREVRRFADSGLVIRLVSLAEHSDRLGPLLAAVQGKYGHRAAPEEFSARLRRQAELLGSRAVVFACFDGADIVGFALAYQWGGELALRVVGFDYERLPGADEYAQLAVHAPLRYCYQRGFRRLHLGTESYQAKCRRGARARPLWAVTSSPTRLRSPARSAGSPRRCPPTRRPPSRTRRSRRGKAGPGDRRAAPVPVVAGGQPPLGRLSVQAGRHRDLGPGEVRDDLDADDLRAADLR